VWTYFQDFRTPSSAIHAQVLEIFIKNWTAQGFVVEVLSEVDARKHSNYRKFKRTVSRYPTTNSPEYELACFLRWMAHNVAKGHLHVDYDVLNYSFNSDMYFQTLNNHEYSGLRILNLDADLVPCAIYIDEATSSNSLIGILMSKKLAKSAEVIKGGRRHVSDMHMFQKLKIGDSKPVCHLEKMKYPLRHFSTSSMGGLEEKILAMKEFISQLN